MIEPHEVDPELVTSVITGMRWACRSCNETVFYRHGVWAHFRTELNLTTVGVNDGDQFSGRCWICNHPTDHDGVPHGEATGDGLTRFRVVDLMTQGGYRWRS